MSALIPDDTVTTSWAEERRARILLKTRLDKMDSMIDNPTEEELDASILDAIDKLNLVAPQTSITVVDAAKSAPSNVQLNHLILIGSCYNIMWTLWDDWAHSGSELNLSILNEPDRMQRFEAAMDKFKEEFDTAALNYKKTNNIRLSKASYSSTSRTTGYGRGTGGRRGFKSQYRSC